MQEIRDEKTAEVTNLMAEDRTLIAPLSLIHNDDFADLSELKIYLSSKINEMMDKNYDKLITTLYRIDIDENKLKKLFASDNHEFIPGKLADLIIDRQLQKINWRNKYKKGEI